MEIKILKMNVKYMKSSEISKYENDWNNYWAIRVKEYINNIFKIDNNKQVKDMIHKRKVSVFNNIHNIIKTNTDIYDVSVINTLDKETDSSTSEESCKKRTWFRWSIRFNSDDDINHKTEKLPYLTNKVQDLNNNYSRYGVNNETVV